MKTTLLKAGLVALAISAIAGCGGGGGGGDSAAAPGTGAPPPATPTTTPITTAVTNPANDTAAAPAAAFTVVADSGVPPVIVNSPPKVNFTVISDGAVVKNLQPGSNARFIIAQLVPGANGAPDQWKSYTYRTRNDASGNPVVQHYAVQDANGAYSTADNLVYNAAGYYTFTFPVDIKDPTKLPPGVTYDPTLVHRVAIQLRYTNAAGKDVRINPYFDFTIDSAGNAVAVTDASKTRKVVDISSCNECHSKLALHGGGRVDTQFCVLCHNPSTTDEVTGNVVDFKIMIHKIHGGEHFKELFGVEYKIQSDNFGEVTYPQPLANCTKCHDGSKKDSAGNQLAAQGDNWKKVPNRAACGACHAGIDFATGKGVTMEDAHEAAEADEATPGSGAAIRSASKGHIGGAQANDSLCTLCHAAVAIPVYHVTVDPTGSSGRAGYPVNTATNVPTPGYPRGQGPSIPLASQLNLPEGVYKIGLEVKQVTVSGAAGAKKATVVYRILKDGQPVTLNASGYLIDGVDGSPSIYIAYAVPQDGIAAPADWNDTENATITAIRDGTGGNSQTGPDASGYYTATLGATIPDNAKHVTAGFGVNYQGFVQLNHADYPKGIRLREPKFVMKVADGFTPRRRIVDGDKCNNCHGQLGVAPSFHGGARNNGEGCAFCHDPNRGTGHVGPNNHFGGGWSVQAKNLIHGIHGGSKRTKDFTYEATEKNPRGFGTVTYPGILKNCEQCHVPGSYDFSASANAAALPNLLWTTDARGNMLNDATTNPTGIASIGLSPWVTTLGAGQIDYSNDNLVSSPIAAACFGCHDDSLPVAHMQSQGGTLVNLFSSVSSTPTRPSVGTASTMIFTRTETCMLCHATGKIADIKVMHAK